MGTKSRETIYGGSIRAQALSAYVLNFRSVPVPGRVLAYSTLGLRWVAHARRVSRCGFNATENQFVAVKPGRGSVGVGAPVPRPLGAGLFLT